jgi:Cys-rich protein (TIGR01571 family)
MPSFCEVLLGQVMHRLKLTSSANEDDSAETASTFRILFWIGISFGILSYFNAFLPLFFTNEKGQLTDSYYIAHYIVSQWLLVYTVLLIWLLCKTRGHIRNKYKIPSALGCEYCCCAFWCTCCTVAQMARHTGDYETYQGMCCSETGLPPDAPSIV